MGLLANLLATVGKKPIPTAFADNPRGSLPLPGARPKAPYVAASDDRLTSSWKAYAPGINEILRRDLDKLRARSRELERNNAFARKFLRLVARNIVGAAGFVLQARVLDAPARPDTMANDAIEAAFWRWSKRGVCDVTGRMSFADLCRSIVTSTARDGEAFVRIVRGADIGGPAGIALQLIDAGRLDTDRNQPAASGRNATIMGIEVDTYRRPISYWIKPSSEASSSAAVQVAASEVLHVYRPEHADQMRGLPWMHASMLDLHHLGEFNHSAMVAARKGADTIGFIVSPTGEAPPGEADEDGTPLDISAPGTYSVLPDGYDIRTPDSAFPNTAYEPFVKAILRRISSGFDVSYNTLASDLEGVNYSSIRAGVLDERDEWMLLQNWFTEAFLEPVFDTWFAHALAAGAIVMDNGSALPVGKRDKFSAHEWQGRRWAWVDPLKDIDAARLAIQTGIASPQMVAAQNGVDTEDVLDSLAAFEAMVKAKGVQSINLAASPAPAPAANGDGQGGTPLP